VAGDGNQDKVKALRHSQRKRRATGLHHLSPRRHSLTLPADPADGAICNRSSLMENLEKVAKVRAGRLSSKPLDGKWIYAVIRSYRLLNLKAYESFIDTRVV
jgi:hypothetical protein